MAMQEIEITAALGRAICQLRKLRGLSQEKLAELAGIHRTYVSQLERGLKSPTVTVLYKLSAALNTSLSQVCRRLEREVDDIYDSKKLPR